MTNNTFSTTELVKLARFPFNDPRWQPKLLILAGLMAAGFIIPVVPFFFAYGYLHRISRAVLAGENEPALPEWTDWERLLKDGLRLYGAALLWGSPAIILSGVAGIFVMAPALAMPIAVFGDQAWTGMNFMLLFGALGYLLLMLGMLVAVALGVILPAIWGRVVQTERFGAAFETRAWWRPFRANLWGCVLAYLLATVVMTIALFAVYGLGFTIILCALIPFAYVAVLTYTVLLESVLFARVYREGQERSGGQAGL